MSQFRQGLGVGRKTKSEGQTGGNSPGRSHWPEPDAIRRLSDSWFGKTALAQHKIDGRAVGNPHNHHPTHPARNVFPRAAFGMPIIFKFKDDKDGEPQSSTLVPVGKERMASPIILRPFRSKNRWMPMALILPTDAQATMKVELKQERNSLSSNISWWSNDPRVAANIPPMIGRGDDPINAFLAFFRRETIRNNIEESRLERARLKLNRTNGSISVTKDGIEANAGSNDAPQLLALLSERTRQRLNNPNEYIRVNAVIVGREIKSLEDAA
ncbi:MAG: hypothetical protein ACYCTY_06510 [Sulfuricella sp.]